MAHILTIGEILVEIMAQQIGQRFDETGLFAGPFPSGAPAIFAAQAARCGSSTRIIGAVGNDGFGTLNLTRLQSYTVDVSKVRVLDDVATGVAFVTYHADGSRDFVFHLANAACGRVDEHFVTADDLHDCRYLHVMGSSLTSAGIYRATRKGLAYAQQQGAIITFDPNVRKEMQRDPTLRRRLIDVLFVAKIILAGEGELDYLLDNADEQSNVATLLAQGAEIVVIKRGSRGASVYLPDQTVQVRPYVVTEIDPTGAGDCFAGAFIACLDQGVPPIEAAQLAAIAGAQAVTRQGPMEGTTTLEELRALARTWSC